MQPTYRIHDWSVNFENSRSRQMKELRYVMIPNKHDGDGYTELLDHPNGAAHFGAWCAIVEVASKCAPRGALVRQDGKPHDTFSMSRLTRIPSEVFAEVLPRLITIGWIESDAEDAERQQNLSDSTSQPEGDGKKPEGDGKVTALRASAYESNSIRKGVEWSGGEGKKKNKDTCSTAAPARSVFDFWKEHLDHPKAVPDPKRLSTISARMKDGYTVDELKDAVRGCKLSDFHMGREPGKPTVYDGVHLIFKDSEHVEKFISLANSSREVSRVPTIKERMEARAKAGKQ